MNTTKLMLTDRKSGCLKFRDVFLRDIGVDPFNLFTTAGACMEVFRAAFLKEYNNTHNYKSMGWLR